MANIVWNKNMIRLLKKEYPRKEAKEIAQEIGVSTNAVHVKANRLGLKKDFSFPKETEEDFKLYFPVKTNKELAEMFNISVRTVVRRARDLKLEKHEYFRLQINFKEAGKKGSKHPKSVATRFKKGQRASIATEFKPGHVPLNARPLLERLQAKTRKKYSHLNSL